MTTLSAFRNVLLPFFTVIGVIAVVLVGLMAGMHFGMMGGAGWLSDIFTACANVMTVPR